VDVIFDAVSARELSLAIWLLALLVFVLTTAPMRTALGGVVRAFVQPLILIPLLAASAYAAAEIWVLAKLGGWSIANLKTTILWLLTFAFVALFEIVAIKDRIKGLRKIAGEIVTITAIFTFVTELKSFPFVVELVAVPLITCLAMMAEMAKHRPEHQIVVKPLGCLLGLIGFGYFGYSLWLSYADWQQTATWATALEFFIPILLSLGFLPFLWLWQFYVVHSDLSVTLAVTNIDEKIIPYARWLALTRIGNDYEMLERWRRAMLDVRPVTKAQLRQSFVDLKAIRAREASPPVIPPDAGWSPYIAMGFMAELGYETGHYNHRFDGEWGASSPMRMVGAVIGLGNNLAYYVDGEEMAATTLKYKLNVKDPASATEAEDMFRAGCHHLLEQAVSLDAVERFGSQLDSGADFTATIPYGHITMTRTEFTDRIKGGYSRRFDIVRGAAS